MALNLHAYCRIDSHQYIGFGRSLKGDVSLKIQRINGWNTRTDKSVSSLGVRKRKLQRRPVLQRKKCRTSVKDSFLESANLSIARSFCESFPICLDDVQECQHTSVENSHLLNRESNDKSGKDLCDVEHTSNVVDDVTDEKSNEFQLCTARFTYGRSLQKSAKIVRRRTVHNKMQEEQVDKSPASPSSFSRKTKGRRSFILRELSTNALKDKSNAEGEFMILT